MNRFCEYCGTPLQKGAKFCPGCGHPIAEQPQEQPQEQPVNQNTNSYQVPEREETTTTIPPTQTRKRKKGCGRIILILSLVFVTNIIVLYFIGEYDLLDRKPKHAQTTKQNSKTAPNGLKFSQNETVTISAENPVSTFKNGATVDFGTMGLLSDAEMSIRETGVSDLNDHQYKVYDFQLGDNEHVDLPMLVKVSLPIEKGWDAEKVTVRAWDDEFNDWVPVYSVVDPSSRKVTFYPEHFSCYATFLQAGKTKDLSAWKDKPLFEYYDKNPTPNSLVYLNEYALAARIKSGGKASESIIQSSWLGKANPKDTQFDLGCNTIYSLSGPAGDLTDVAGGGLVLMGEGESPLANSIGNLGTAITFVQLFGTYYRTGSIVETTKQHWDALAKMGADYVLKKVGMSTGWLAVIYMAYLGEKKIAEMIDLTQHLGASNDIEFAYREFTFNYVFVDTKTTKVNIHYQPGAATDPWKAVKMTSGSGGFDSQGLGVQDSEVRLVPISGSTMEMLARSQTSIRTGCELEWSVLLNNIAKRAKTPSDMMYKIDDMIDNYCRAFWKLDNRTLQTFLKEHPASYASSKKLISVWEEQTLKERENYINKMKTTIYAANKDVIKDLLDKSYVTMVNNVYREAVRIESQLNERMTFTLKDNAVKNFSKSPYADCDLRIRQFEFNNPEDFRFTKDNNYTVTCTRHAWLLSRRGGNYPKYLDIKGKEPIGEKTVEFQYSVPKTVIHLNSDGVAEDSGAIPDELARLLAPYGGIGKVIPDLRGDIGKVSKCSFTHRPQAGEAAYYDVTVYYSNTSCRLVLYFQPDGKTPYRCMFIPPTGEKGRYPEEFEPL